jgi:hypothetical protein
MLFLIDSQSDGPCGFGIGSGPYFYANRIGLRPAATTTTTTSSSTPSASTSATHTRCTATTTRNHA